MRYAIVSDIHSNLPAWNAVLADLSALKARKIVCLGDVVGYGPQPEAVLESAYRHIDYFVMGNHDAVVAGKMADDAFNDLAKTMVRWTAARVPAKAKAFLAEQPLVLEGKGFVCVHGSLDRPQAFNYIVSPQEALDTWSATDAQLVFVGHSHIPGIFVLGESGTPHLIPSQDFVVEEGKRYIVNAGSVGDPRDADPRASYCLYDDATGIVTFRRVAFDYDAVRAAAAKAGLDESSIPLLRHDPIPLRETVRDSLGFAPPSRDADMAQNIVASGYIGSLRKANSRLRLGISAAITAFMAAAGVATALALRGGSHAASFPEAPLEPRQAILAQNRDSLSYPEMGTADNLGSSSPVDDEKILLCVKYPEIAPQLLSLALLVRNQRLNRGVVALNVVYDDELSARHRDEGLQLLERLQHQASAAEVGMQTQVRLASNIANGIKHAFREHSCSEVIMGMHVHTESNPKFWGDFIQSLYNGLNRQILLIRFVQPLNTLRRIQVAVPSRAEFEPGFHRWLERISRLAGQLDCRIQFHGRHESLILIAEYINNRHPSVRAEYTPMGHWNELPRLASTIQEDHLFVVVTARKGTISYKNALERLPDELQQYFSGKNLMIIFPDQYGDQKEDRMSFTEAQHHEETSLYTMISQWIHRRK